MSQLAVPENKAIVPMPNKDYLTELSSSNTLPLSKSVPIGEQMRTRMPWKIVRNVHENSDEHKRTDSIRLEPLDIDKALQEVRVEAQEERKFDSELDPVPETAYKDVGRFLRGIYTSDYGSNGRLMSLADIMPLDNGAIGIEWREGQKIFTLSFAGDEHMVFAGIFSEESKVRGVLTFSTLHLFAIIDMISSLYP